MSKFMQHINFSGLVVYQSSGNKKVKISITDRPTVAKLNKILKADKYKDLRTPIQKDIFQIVLGSRTKITSEEGKENISALPAIVGWRVKGKLLIKKYSFKSTWKDNTDELIEGVTLSAVQIHLGA